MEIDIIISLLFFAFCAGAIDAAVGGGGLIQIPAIMNAMPQLSPATVFGTNKLSSICGTASAQVQIALEAAGDYCQLCFCQLICWCGLCHHDSQRSAASLCTGHADCDCDLYLYEKAVWASACAAGVNA